MKKLISTLAAVFCMVYANAQPQWLIGKWKFKEPVQTADLDSTDMAMLNKIFSSMTIYLKANGEYKSYFMNTDEGHYTYDNALRHLTLHSNRGSRSQSVVIPIDNQTMQFSFEEGKAVILERAPITAEDEQTTAKPAFELVSITPEQLCKKWYFKKRIVPDRTEAQMQLMSDLFRETHYEFKSDHIYTVNLLGITESGDWNLENNNQTLTLSAKGESKIWNIKKITATQLELIKGNTNEVWVFGVEE